MVFLDDPLNIGSGLMGCFWPSLLQVIFQKLSVLEIPKPFVHCSLTDGLVAVDFPNNSISLWECLVQSYINHNVCSFFKPWCPGVSNSENIFELNSLWCLSHTLYTKCACHNKSSYIFPEYSHMLMGEDSHKYCIIWQLLEKFHKLSDSQHMMVLKCW